MKSPDPSFRPDTSPVFSGASGDALLIQGVILTDKKEYQTLVAEAEKLVEQSTRIAITDRIALRDAVCAYLAAERKNGVRIESVRASVEKILHSSARDGDGDGADSKAMAGKLINWCVQKQRSEDMKIVE